MDTTPSEKDVLREREVITKETDAQSREREVRVKEEELQLKRRELDLKEREQALSKWRNPLVVSILAASLAGGANALATYVAGRNALALEGEKAKASAIAQSHKWQQDQIEQLSQSVSKLTDSLRKFIFSEQERLLTLLRAVAPRKTGLFDVEEFVAKTRASAQSASDAYALIAIRDPSLYKKLAPLMAQLDETVQTIETAARAVLEPKKVLVDGMRLDVTDSKAFLDAFRSLSRFSTELAPAVSQVFHAHRAEVSSAQPAALVAPYGASSKASSAASSSNVR